MQMPHPSGRTQGSKDALIPSIAWEGSSGVCIDRCIKRKYISFSAEQRALIGRYAAEHSNSAAVKKFKSDFEQGLGESTVRLFKKRYLEELKKAKETLPVGEAPVVKEIAVKTRGRPLGGRV